jgi:hypothetical protein
MNNPKYSFRKKDIPTTPHWAILEFTSIHVEGDERSRTNPGHGYPASDEPVVLYLAFDDLSSMESYIRQHCVHKPSYKDDIRILQVTPKTVVMHTSITIEDPIPMPPSVLKS